MSKLLHTVFYKIDGSGPALSESFRAGSKQEAEQMLLEKVPNAMIQKTLTEIPSSLQ
jgi:hypothetical protein